MVEYTKSFGIKYNDIVNYKPRPGVNLNVFKVDNETLTALAQLIVNSEHPDPSYRRYKEELDQEVSKLKIVTDRVRDRDRPRGKQMRYETNLDSITKEMDYLRSRVKIKHGNFGEVDIS